MKKAFLTLLVVAAVLAGTPSSAGAALSQCARGEFCAWSDDGFEGTFRGWQGSDANWVDDGINDDAESVFNNALSSSTVPDNVFVYLDAGHVGLDICVHPGETFDAGMNDNDYSSHQWVHSC